MEHLRVESPCIFAIVQSVIDHIGKDFRVNSVNHYQSLDGIAKVYVHLQFFPHTGVTVMAFSDGTEVVIHIWPSVLHESYTRKVIKPQHRLRLLQCLPWLGEEDLYDLISEYLEPKVGLAF